MKVTQIGSDCIFFSFRTGDTDNDFFVPPDIEEWLKVHVKSPEWGFVRGKRFGVFLTAADAVAFKLRFNV